MINTTGSRTVRLHVSFFQLNYHTVIQITSEKEDLDYRRQKLVSASLGVTGNENHKKFFASILSKKAFFPIFCKIFISVFSIWAAKKVFSIFLLKSTYHDTLICAYLILPFLAAKCRGVFSSSFLESTLAPWFNNV